jgi:cytochrome c-type biogenesis protein
LPVRTGAAILLLGFGLLMIWLAPFEWLSIRAGDLINGGSLGFLPRGQGNLGGFVLGTTLSLIWTIPSPYPVW